MALVAKFSYKEMNRFDIDAWVQEISETLFSYCWEVSILSKALYGFTINLSEHTTKALGQT